MSVNMRLPWWIWLFRAFRCPNEIPRCLELASGSPGFGPLYRTLTRTTFGLKHGSWQKSPYVKETFRRVWVDSWLATRAITSSILVPVLNGLAFVLLPFWSIQERGGPFHQTECI